MFRNDVHGDRIDWEPVYLARRSTLYLEDLSALEIQPESSKQEDNDSIDCSRTPCFTLLFLCHSRRFSSLACRCH